VWIQVADDVSHLDMADVAVSGIVRIVFVRRDEQMFMNAQCYWAIMLAQVHAVYKPVPDHHDVLWVFHATRILLTHKVRVQPAEHDVRGT
jgi:hypothetical protein